MKNKMTLLSSLYSCFGLFYLLFFIIGIAGQMEIANFIITLIPLLFIIMTSISLWLLTVEKNTKAALILLRVKGILKYIYIIAASIFICFLLLIIQDCSHSIGSPDANLSFIDKAKIVYPFTLLILFATIYLVFYNIMLSIVNNENPNKALMTIYGCLNICIIIILVVLGIINIIKKEGIYISIVSYVINNANNFGYIVFIGMIIIYIAMLSYSIYLLFNKINQCKNIQTIDNEIN